MSTYRRHTHHTHSNNLSSSAAASSQPMSGAEMLVLQQSLKQYILTRQTRELTDHEMQEFEKLRSRLLPSLQRYSQSQSTASTPPTSTLVTPRGGGGRESGMLRSNSSHTADSVAKRTSYNNNSSSQQGRLATAGSQQQQSQRKSQQQQQQQQQVHQGTSGRSKTPLLYPASSSSARPVSTTAQKQPRTSFSTSSQSRSTVASKPSREPLVKQELSQSTSNIILKPTTSKTSTSTPNTSRASTATKAGQRSDSNNKRPKVSVYQDKENAPTKRRRLRTQAEHESDSDKENRDPLAYTTTPTTPRRTNVLGEKTNFMNNVLNNTAGMKGKDVLRNIVASKIVDMAAAAPLAKPKTTKPSQQQQQQQTRLYPSTPASITARVTMVEPPITEKQVAPTRILAKADVQQRAVEGDEQSIVTSQSRSSTTKESDTKGVPTQSEQGASHGCLLLNVKQEPVDNVRPESVDNDRLEPVTTPERPAVVSSQEKQDNIIRVPETPPRKTAGVSQIPASVEDDDSQGSFERLLKAERAANKPTPRHGTAINYEEVADSQASHTSSDSTASLEETFPMPEFLLEGLPEDPQHDEAEVTLVDADKPNQSNCRVSTTAVPIGHSQSTSQSSRRNSTLQSTAFADGMWCIEDMKHRIIETVCSFQDQWVALESTSHVQFWRLDEDTPSAKSQWVRYIHLPKTSARSTQIFFAPDDSFAVVMDLSERSFTKLPLQDLDFLRESDPAFPTYTWTGLQPSSRCKGFIVEQESDGGHMIVVPTEEAGSVGFISVLNDEDRSGVMTQAKFVDVPGVQERVSSLALIGNTSLVAATFGSTFAAWDVNSLEKPVFVVDTSTLSLIEPSLVYASVPIQFFEEEKLVGKDRSPPEKWPILAVFRDKTQSDQCALYAIKDSRIERIHQYHGSSSISSTCASSRFIAGHVSANGKDLLQLWDISNPDPMIQLALLEPPSLEKVATRRSIQQQNIWRQQVGSAIMKEEEKGAGNGAKGAQDDLDDLFSSVSTLSPPPDDLSSPPYPSVEAEPAAALPEVRTPSPQRRRPTVGAGQRQQGVSHQRGGSRPPVDWINLTSIAAMERKEVQFSMHSGQQWVVIVQKSAFKRTPSVIHILDLMSILSPSSSPSSSP